MKVRTGFVSNSSSSSFIIQGYMIDSKQIPAEISKDFYSITHSVKGMDSKVDGDDYYIGKILMDGVEEESVQQLDVKPIKNIKPIIEKFLKDNKIEINESNFGIFAGNTYNWKQFTISVLPVVLHGR